MYVYTYAYMCVHMCMHVYVGVFGHQRKQSLFLETLMRINRCDSSLDSVRWQKGFLFHSCDTYNTFFLLAFCTCSLVYLVSDLLDPSGFPLSLSFLFDVISWSVLGQIFSIILVQGTSSASTSVFTSASSSVSTSASSSAPSSFLPLFSGFVYCPSAVFTSIWT